jgi:hypothetical protein
MTERNDYDGSFDPAISYEDFSKEFLLKALKSYGRYIHKLDGIWYLSLKKRAGDDLAFETDLDVWKTMEVHDVRSTCELFGIKGNDVETLIKATQMSPYAWVLDRHFELKSPRLGIWTVTRCPTLLALEKEGEGRESRICGQVETKLFEIRAKAINPKMKVTPLKLPPRKSKDEIACQWEFRLDE